MCQLHRAFRKALSPKRRTTRLKPIKKLMDRLRDPLFKACVMTVIMALEISFILSLNQFKSLSIYWIVLALLHLSFWVTSFYPNYHWPSMNPIRKCLALWVSVTFCFYFFPTDILLSDRFDNIHRLIGLIGVAVALLDTKRDDDNDDDDDGHLSKAEHHGPKKDWAFLSNQT